jgi:hypothetical protein
MNKLNYAARASLGLICFFIFPVILLAEETLTITTYYPSPYGSYNELTANRMKIGANSTATTLTDDDNGKLLVDGPLGIGTTNPDPTSKLYVEGNVTINGTISRLESIKPVLGKGWNGLIWLGKTTDIGVIKTRINTSCPSASLTVYYLSKTGWKSTGNVDPGIEISVLVDNNGPCYFSQFDPGIGLPIIYDSGYYINTGDITASGKVGIGTTSPGTKLEVNGTIMAGGGSANQAICWKADGKTLGYCNATVNATGGCGTCN